MLEWPVTDHVPDIKNMMEEKLKRLLEGLECGPELCEMLSANQMYALWKFIAAQAKSSPGKFDLADVAKAISEIR